MINIGGKVYEEHILQEYVRAMNIKTPYGKIVSWDRDRIDVFVHGYKYGREVKS